MSYSPHRRTFFPSIPSPSYKSKRSIDLSEFKINNMSPLQTKSKLGQSTTSFHRSLDNSSKMSNYSSDQKQKKDD